jgi:hypothetical protein
MKQALFVLLIFQNYFLVAQTKEPVFYFITKDSLVGVKNSKGKIIIPAKNLLLYDIKNGEKISDAFIHLLEADDTTNTSSSFGKIYDHTGSFLYHPYIFDNGPDGLQEGLCRFVENHKIGFVNRHGKKVIPAQFDFVSSFNLGTAVFCMGCHFDFKKNSEHPPLAGGVYGMIDNTGKVLIADVLPEKNAILDSLQKEHYTKNRSYSPFEKKLTSKLDPYLKNIEKEYFSNYSNLTEPHSLVFDIVERPSAGFNYYVIQSREKMSTQIYSNTWDDLLFFVSRDGRKLFYFDAGTLVPFSKWYAIYLKGERNYE